MKNFLLLLVVSIFMGCSKDDKEENKDVIGLTFEMSYDVDGKGPEGDIFIFQLEGQYISENIHPTFFEYKGEPMCAISDVNGEYIFQTFRRNFSSQKDKETGKYINKSNASIRLTEGQNDLNIGEGISLKGNYLVFIHLTSSPYSYTFNKITVDDVINIKHIFKRETDDYSQFEEWQ